MFSGIIAGISARYWGLARAIELLAVFSMIIGYLSATAAKLLDYRQRGVLIKIV